MFCPLCGGNCVKNDVSSDYALVHCLTYGKVINVSKTIESSCSDIEAKKAYNLLFEAVMKTEGDGLSNGQLWYYYDPNYKTQDGNKEKRIINLSEIEYPNSVSDKTDRALLNLKRINSSIGYVFKANATLERALFVETNEEKDTMGVLSLLLDSSYIKKEDNLGYRITKTGWEHIEDLEACDGES